MRLVPVLILLLATSACPIPGDDDSGALTETGASSTTASLPTSTGLDGTTDSTRESNTSSSLDTGGSDTSTSTGTNSSTSSGSDTSTGSGSDTSTGSDDASTSSSGSGSSDSGEETEGTTGGEDPPDTSCATSCSTGCEDVILSTLQGETTLWHAGTSRLALDQASRAILWDAPVDDVIAIIDGVSAADLAGSVFAVQLGTMVSLRSTFDGAELGMVDVTGASWGLARDGSYLWVADAASLRVFETNGSLRWDRPGDYSLPRVLPLPAAVHVQAPVTGATVEDVDAATGMASALPFDGTFDGWFHDQPRFWTLQGDAFRLYDVDGSLLAFAMGLPVHGYGDWLVFDGYFGDIVAVTDVTTPVYTVVDAVVSGAGILSDVVAGTGELIRLDQPGIMPQMATVPCCTGFPEPIAFAFADGEWIVGADEGQVADEQLDVLSVGEIEYVHGSAAGTFGLTAAYSTVSLWEVDPACMLSELGFFPRNRPAEGLLSGDGSTFLAVAKHPQLSLDLYDTATGMLFDTTVYGLNTSNHRGMQVSDAADLFGLRSINTGFSDSTVLAYPGFSSWFDGMWAKTPAVSPNGMLAVRNDAIGGLLNSTFEGSLSYAYDATGLLAIFDGVTHGFVDDSTLLVAHYTYVPMPGGCFQPGECDTLMAVELVDPMGMPIAASPIPDPARFERVSSTEVFLPDPPAIYDVYTGALLWSGAPGPAAPVGPDHVAHVVGNDLVLTRWR